MDRKKIIQMVVILAAIVVIATSFSKMLSRDSLSLSDYARQNSSTVSDQQTDGAGGKSSSSKQPDGSFPDADQSGESSSGSGQSDEKDSQLPETPLTGAALNGASQEELRYTLEDGFYYEPVSEKLRRYMTGISYPIAEDIDTSCPAPSFEDLSYVHILHYDFQGNVTEGELVCNSAIALDLLEIFYELYRNEYKLEHVLLADEYNGEELSSMENNNSFCFNCPPEAAEHALRHGQGLSVDINPLYNPCVTYGEDGEEQVSPSQAFDYANRIASFPYKIDENDLCYKLFVQHGFTWGGHWNDGKCYQHFQKSIP